MHKQLLVFSREFCNCLSMNEPAIGYRAEPVFSNLLAWLRDKGVTGSKPLHQLRKLYGSVLAEKHGIHAASSGLRHADIRITSAFYANRSVKLTPGFGASLAGADVVAFPPASERRSGKNP